MLDRHGSETRDCSFIYSETRACSFSVPKKRMANAKEMRFTGLNQKPIYIYIYI